MSKFKIMLCCTFHSSGIVAFGSVQFSTATREFSHVTGKGQIDHTYNMVHGKTEPKDWTWFSLTCEPLTCLCFLLFVFLLLLLFPAHLDLLSDNNNNICISQSKDDRRWWHMENKQSLICSWPQSADLSKGKLDNIFYVGLVMRVHLWHI